MESACKQLLSLQV